MKAYEAALDMGHPRNEKKNVTLLYTGGRFRPGERRNNLEFGKGGMN